MSPLDPLPIPTKIPDDLWHDLKRVKAHLATFVYKTQLSVQENERLTGEYDFDLYKWLQPLVETVNQMRKIERYRPTTAEVVPFPGNA